MTDSRISIARSMALQYFDHSDEILKNVLNALDRTNTMCEVFASAKNIHKDEISERDFAKILKNGTIKPLTKLLNEGKREGMTLNEFVKRDTKDRDESTDCALSDVAIAGSHVGSLRSDDLTSLRSDDFEDRQHVDNDNDDAEEDWGDDDFIVDPESETKGVKDDLDEKKKCCACENCTCVDCKCSKSNGPGCDPCASHMNKMNVEKKDSPAKQNNSNTEREGEGEEDWGDDGDFASNDDDDEKDGDGNDENWGDEEDDWGDDGDFEPEDMSSRNAEDNVDEFSETESLPATGAVDIKQFSALRIAADAELLKRLQNEVQQLRQENLKLRESSPIKN